ncbi:MAG TPA: hypothetical protein VF712_08920 [Thermoleophilaceae bacterium]|jgi:hypothetical protein
MSEARPQGGSEKAGGAIETAMRTHDGPARGGRVHVDELQISNEAERFLTRAGIQRLRLIVSSRRLACSLCGEPLGDRMGPTSVGVVRGRDASASVVRLTHFGCTPSEVRVESAGDERPARPRPGHEWNLARRFHPVVPSLLAWELFPPLGGERTGARWHLADDPLALELRQAGFVTTRGRISELLPPTACRLTLVEVGTDLIILRDGRHWARFPGAAGAGAPQAWVAETRRERLAVVLYGPGLGGNALMPGNIDAALDSGMTLGTTVRMPAGRARYAVPRPRPSRTRGPKVHL